MIEAVDVQDEATVTILPGRIAIRIYGRKGECFAGLVSKFDQKLLRGPLKRFPEPSSNCEVQKGKASNAGGAN